MNKAFISQLKSIDAPLFYNSSGSKEAYQLNIKHLSFAPVLGLAIKAGEYIYPKKKIFLVDLENEKIEIVEDKIKLIPLATF